jgi:hypothetical protein
MASNRTLGPCGDLLSHAWGKQIEICDIKAWPCTRCGLYIAYMPDIGNNSLRSSYVWAKSVPELEEEIVLHNVMEE